MSESWDWPEGARCAVSLTFDVDAESGFLGDGPEYARRLTTLSEGRFGVVRGVPRILGLLRAHGLHATFFVPGDTAERHPAVGRPRSSRTATRSATTATSTCAATRSRPRSSARSWSRASPRWRRRARPGRAATARRPGS